ncbi:MAG: hypothetical protein ACM3X9_06150 [Bacillota bacterium]
MYIVGLNSKEKFYFISREDQREQLEKKGILVLNTTYDRITAAASAVRELNEQVEQERRTSILGKVC